MSAAGRRAWTPVVIAATGLGALFFANRDNFGALYLAYGAGLLLVAVLLGFRGARRVLAGPTPRFDNAILLICLVSALVFTLILHSNAISHLGIEIALAPAMLGLGVSTGVTIAKIVDPSLGTAP
ncbi:MAG: hypothetical protein ACRELB_24870 [Polyangiaceae bacterium]